MAHVKARAYNFSQEPTFRGLADLTNAKFVARIADVEKLISVENNGGRRSRPPVRRRDSPASFFFRLSRFCGDRYKVLFFFWFGLLALLQGKQQQTKQQHNQHNNKQQTTSYKQQQSTSELLVRQHDHTVSCWTWISDVLDSNHHRHPSSKPGQRGARRHEKNLPGL